MHDRESEREPAGILDSDAAIIRKTGIELGELIDLAGTIVEGALARGNDVTVCGNRTSGALVAAAGLDYNVYLPPGRAGDVLLVVMPGEAPEELPGVIAAARERGITAIALLSTLASPLAEVADLCLRVPTAELGPARLAMVAMLRAIGGNAADRKAQT